MTKATILRHLFEMMETGKQYNEIEQSVRKIKVKIPQTSTIDKNSTKL